MLLTKLLISLMVLSAVFLFAMTGKASDAGNSDANAVQAAPPPEEQLTP
jgi:hypothetical protein